MSDPGQSSYRWIGIRHMLFLHTHADWPPLEKKNKIWLDFVMEFCFEKSLDIFLSEVIKYIL